MTDNQDALLPHLKESAQVGLPYSYSQISETVLHWEILRIYREARPETRPYYDLGHDTEGITEENWVIRWLIWHVFRYRDNRNRHRRTDSPSETLPDGDPGSGAGQRQHSKAGSGSSGSSHDNGANGRRWRS